MTLSAGQIRVPGTGELFVNSAGSAAPIDVETAMAAGWKGLGYTQSEGVTLGRSMDREPVEAWQSVTPLRYIYNAANLTISAAMLQSNGTVAGLWWGGGDFAETSTGSGVYKSDMPTIPTGVERAVVLEFTDGDKVARVWVPRMDLSETGDVTLNRQGATAFQLTFTAMAPESGSVIATWLTNDASFAPPAA
jgi:hypothetical protein